MALSSLLSSAFNLVSGSILPSLFSDPAASDDGEPSSSSDPYTPTEADISSVQSHLLHFLPTELVDSIIDTAEYWPCIVAEQEGDPHLCARASDHNNSAAGVCLVTSPLPDGCKKVRRVRFMLSSHDQGWGGERPGTYEAAYSWFDACIVRHGSVPREGTVTNVHELNRLLEDAEVRNEAEDARERRWHLQRNFVASGTDKIHDFVWERGCVMDEVKMRETGCGSGKGFADTLQPGDKVGVIARAVFPGWSNTVNQVKVEIFYMV